MNNEWILFYFNANNSIAWIKSAHNSVLRMNKNQFWISDLIRNSFQRWRNPVRTASFNTRMRKWLEKAKLNRKSIKNYNNIDSVSVLMIIRISEKKSENCLGMIENVPKCI